MLALVWKFAIIKNPKAGDLWQKRSSFESKSRALKSQD